MRTVNQKSSGPSVERLLQGIDRFVRIDEEAVGIPYALGKEIRADKPDATVEFQVICRPRGQRYEKGVRFNSDRRGKEARDTGGNSVPAAEIYKQTKS